MTTQTKATSIFGRLYQRLYDVRMQQAMREVNRHRQFREASRTGDSL